MKNVLNYRKKQNNNVEMLYGKIMKRVCNCGGIIKVNNLNKTKICPMPSLTVIIDYEGNVVLCHNDYFSSVKFGNLKREKLMEIWNKPNYKKVREELIRGELNIDLCKKCGLSGYNWKLS